MLSELRVTEQRAELGRLLAARVEAAKWRGQERRAIKALVGMWKDDAIFESKLRGLLHDWDHLSKDIQADPRAEHVLQQIMQQGFLRGATDAPAKVKKVTTDKH